MFEFINYSADKVIVLLLIIVRTSGLFMTAPIYSDKGIPKLIKVGLVLILSLVLMPVVQSLNTLPAVTSTWQLLGLALNEILIGFIIGLFFRFIFIGVMIGGNLAGYQMGLMFANMFDQDQKTQISIISRFWYIIAILFFLSINGHHLIINAFAESYQVIPLGNLNTESGAGEMIIKYSGYMFIIAIKIVSPVMITLFLIDISLGTIAKMMPTMNVFFVGMPIKISVGMMMMALSLPLFVYVLEKTMTYMDSELRVLLYSLGRA